MNKLNAVIYARFSSHNQNEMSIDAQVRACKDYARINKINVLRIYSDEAKSATTANRPEFQRMLSDSANREFHIVLIHKTDRFARNKKDSIESKAILEKNGVKVISVTEQFTENPEGFMLETVIEGMAQYFSMNLGREVRKGQKEAALNLMFLGGVPPFGYKVINQKIVINDFNANAVKLIFDMYCSGYSYQKIADELNNRGYTTQRGKQFGKNSIRNILINERYTGVYIYNQRESKGKYSGTRNNSAYKNITEIIRIENGIPQIISKEQFQKVQNRLKEHEHLKGGKKHRYILSGKVKCSCGGLMSGNTRKSGRNKIQHSYYRCNKCGHEINTKYLDKFAIKYIKLSIKLGFQESLSKITDEFNEYIQNNKDGLNSELQALKMTIDGNKKKIENLLDKLSDIENANGQSDALLNKITSLEDTNKRLIKKEMELNEILSVKYSKNQVNQAYKSLLKYIKKNDTLAVRNFIDEYVSEVIIDKDNDKVTVITT